MKPFVSIIVPAYNEAHHVKNLIETLLVLDYPHDRYEIIIVDNKSTDITSTIIKKYPVTYLLEDATQSSYAARNAGVRNARGDILAFTDADCLVDNEWLTNVVAAFQCHKADIVSGSIAFTANARCLVGLYDTIMCEDSQRRAAEKGRSAGGNLAARRDVFERIGFFDARLISGGDGEWVARATSAGFKLTYCDRAKVYHSARSLSEVLERSFRIGFGNGQIDQLSRDSSEQAPECRRRKFHAKWIFRGIRIYGRQLRAVNLGVSKQNLGLIRRLELNLLAVFLQTLSFCGWVKGKCSNV